MLSDLYLFMLTCHDFELLLLIIKLVVKSDMLCALSYVV